MRVYSMLRPTRLEEFPDAIKRAEELGYDGTTLLELTVPPTLSAVAGAMTTEQINLLAGVLSHSQEAQWQPRMMPGQFSLCQKAGFS